METKRNLIAKDKLIVILGPTASGKTGLSIKLAKKISAKGGPASGWNGVEIVSADSRQVYEGMDIGTGKVTKKEMAGIPHYLLDVANPKNRFSVAQYQKLALRAIKNIQKKNKIPFLVGGTGFYIQSVIDGIVMPEIKPDWKLRKKLEKLTTEQLFKKLEKLDPERAKSIDRYNPRRLIRALEIVLKSKKPVPPLSQNKPEFETLILGIKKEEKELKKIIEKRLLKRLKIGMIDEVEKLHKSGVLWKRLEEFGLEYRFVAQYLQGKLKYDEMVSRLGKEIEHYAKRQMTWFKRDKRTHWVHPHTKKDFGEIMKLCKKFLEK